jgi:hypothetical protein
MPSPIINVNIVFSLTDIIQKALDAFIEARMSTIADPKKNPKTKPSARTKLDLGEVG